MKEKEKVVKSAAWYTISNIMIRAVSIVTAPIFTRLLTTSDYGIVSNYTTWVEIWGCLTALGLTYSIARGKVEFKEKFPQYLSSVQFLVLISSFVFFLLACLFSQQLSEYMKIDRPLVIFMFGFLCFYPSVSMAQTNYQFEYKYKNNIAISLFNTFANIIIAISLILLFDEKPYVGRIMGIALPALLLGIVFSVSFFIKGKTFYSKKYWKYALTISLPMIPHAMAMLLLGQIDRVMIVKMCGNSEAGIYSFGYSYAILLGVITNAINQALQPAIYKKLNENESEGIENITHKVLKGVTILAIVASLIGPEALKILGTSDYYDGIWVICPVVFGSVFQLMYQNYSLLEVFYKKTIIIAIGSVCAALINAGLNYIFIKIFGYLAAGWTTLVGYLFLMFFHFWGAKIAAHKIIFKGKIMMIEFLMIIICLAICTATYLLPFYYRYLVLALIFAIVLIKYKNIIKTFMCRGM